MNGINFISVFGGIHRFWLRKTRGRERVLRRQRKDVLFSTGKADGMSLTLPKQRHSNSISALNFQLSFCRMEYSALLRRRLAAFDISQSVEKVE